MEAGAKRIQEIFQSNIVLKIPYFQRTYVWDKPNWDRFLNDMLDLLETQDKYFLGSVILKKAGSNEQGFEQYDVVDGQQRLTTLVVFAKILYLMAGKNDEFRHTFVQYDSTASILQPNRKDADAFNQIVKLDCLNGIGGKGQVKAAFDYFVEKMNTFGIQTVANRLILSFINKVYFVSIKVEENENEQQIFDTINSLGQDLTTGELLKNYLFSEENEALYDGKWAPTFENGGTDYNYWTEQLTKGRLKANNIETFFYYFMLIKMQNAEIRSNLTPIEKKQYRKQEGLFESYKSLIRKHNIEKNYLIYEIVDYAKLYHNNIKQDVLREPLVKYQGIQRISFLMFAQGTWTPVPYLLYILKNVTDENEQVRIFGYLETYLVRRIICRSKNNNYSDLFSENMIGQGVNTFEKLKKYFNDTDNRGALLMPSDADVKEALQTNDLSKSATILLYLIESKINAQFANDEVDNSYTAFSVEPLMPVKQDLDKWPINPDISKENRDVLVKTLGNYVLVRGNKLSATNSGLKWILKKKKMEQAIVGIQISKIAETSLSWNETNIRNRNEYLANRINEIWMV